MNFSFDSSVKVKEIFIILFFDADNNAFVKVVNNHRKPVDFEYLLFYGIERQALQTINNISQSKNYTQCS